jgi:hypothetical protein
MILLTTLMNMEISEYNSFVTVLAAGLSERVTHTYFEKDLMKNAEEKYVSLEEARSDLVWETLTNVDSRLYLLTSYSFSFADRNNSIPTLLCRLPP